MLTNTKFSMGKHLLLEVYEVEYDLLNDSETLEEVMLQGINDGDEMRSASTVNIR